MLAAMNEIWEGEIVGARCWILAGLNCKVPSAVDAIVWPVTVGVALGFVCQSSACREVRIALREISVPLRKGMSG